ncbi:LppU/SCO3897 family protein [Kitasatospora sp. McL0602]|uniref:LppU/SCO3897 family protein n=1 Tax=Kitasatospora sp. McL0602 TaxID=3439530 RepID=UPI003F89CD95
MPTEVTLTLTPAEAASGVTKVVSLPSGSRTVRLPPVRDADVIRVATEEGEVLLRIRVYSGPPRPSRLGGLGRPLLGLGVIGLSIFIGVALSDHDSSSSSDAYVPPAHTYTTPAAAYTPPAPAYTAPTPAYSPSAYTPPAQAYSPPAYSPAPSTAKPHLTGTCLNGTLVDSTTAQRVNDVSEVACSAPDAHYQVIRAFPATADMSRCASVSGTQYSFSSKELLNGAVIWSYVYCLVGLGSYAR